MRKIIKDESSSSSRKRGTEALFAQYQSDGRQGIVTESTSSRLRTTGERKLLTHENNEERAIRSNGATRTHLGNRKF